MTGVPTLDPGVSAYVPGVPVLAGPTCWVRCAICRKDADPFTAFSGAELANGAARRCKRCLPGQLCPVHDRAVEPPVPPMFFSFV